MTKDRLRRNISTVQLGRKRAALTGGDDEVSGVTSTVTRSDTCHPLASTRLVDNQMLEFTLRPAQDEFYSCFLAQVLRIYTGLFRMS